MCSFFNFLLSEIISYTNLVIYRTTNILERIPINSVTAKPFIGPVPNWESIKAAIDKEFEESSCIESIFITGSKSYLIASYLEKLDYQDNCYW